MMTGLRLVRPLPEIATSPNPCEHRMVSKDGRIVCTKIVEGENAVSAEVCRECPVRAINCAHLRFSLRQATGSPLVVRYNGRTEIWDDEAAGVRFERAACAAQVRVVEHPRACAGCRQRCALEGSGSGIVERPRQVVAGGKVVAFPGREVVAATG
jgi:hypothetical protein